MVVDVDWVESPEWFSGLTPGGDAGFWLNDMKQWWARLAPAMYHVTSVSRLSGTWW